MFYYFKKFIEKFSKKIRKLRKLNLQKECATGTQPPNINNSPRKLKISSLQKQQVPAGFDHNPLLSQAWSAGWLNNFEFFRKQVETSVIAKVKNGEPNP